MSALTGRLLPLPTSPTLGDEALVRRVLAGDRWGREMLYRRHGPRLLAMVARLLTDRAAAEEVVRKTFVTAFGALATLHDPATVRTWLARIALARVRRRARWRHFTRRRGLDRHPDDATFAASTPDGTSDARGPRRPLENAFLDPTNEAALARVWRSIDASAPMHRPGRAGTWAVTSAVVTAAVVIAAWGFERRDHDPLPWAQRSVAGGKRDGIAGTAKSRAPQGVPTRTTAPTWRELAQGGRHDEAFSALGAEGIAREARHGDVADLLMLGDVARLSGHAEASVAPLAQIVRSFPHDPHAPVAALTLGLLELDTLDRPADAAAALERALTLELPPSLRHEVRARLVDAYARAGDRSAARAAAAAYAREFPEGPRLRQRGTP